MNVTVFYESLNQGGMVTHKWRWVGILYTNLPLMKRNIYHPAIGCSCGLHTWPILLQSVCNYASLFNYKPVGQASDSIIAPTKSYSF